MRQSRRGTMSGTMKSTRSLAATQATTGTLGRSTAGAAATLRSTASRKSTNFAMINGSRNPPRPAPSMVNYSDEDSAKGYDENPDDSDSLTEKPSEISSTDSQVIIRLFKKMTFFKKWVYPRPLFVYFRSFQAQNLQKKTVGVSGIQTRMTFGARHCSLELSVLTILYVIHYFTKGQSISTGIFNRISKVHVIKL